MKFYVYALMAMLSVATITSIVKIDNLENKLKNVEQEHVRELIYINDNLNYRIDNIDLTVKDLKTNQSIIEHIIFPGHMEVEVYD